MKTLLAIGFLLITTQSHAQFDFFGGGEVPVRDSTNIIQNIEQVVRLGRQLEDMARNSKNVSGIWGQLLPQLEQYALRLCQGEASAYCDPNVIAIFRQRWPGYGARGYRWEQDYYSQTQTVLDGIANALRASQEQERAMRAEEERIQSASQKSELAVGRLQAQQSTNMLLAELSHQVMLLRQEQLTATRIQATAAAQRTSREAQALQIDRNFLLNAAPITLPTYGATGMGSFRPLGK